MNLEKTLEALDRAIETRYEFESRIAAACGKQSSRKDRDAATLQSLRDALPQLLADAEAFRKMKERGAWAWVIPSTDASHVDGFIDAMAWQEGEFSKPLYALPDTKESGR